MATLKLRGTVYIGTPDPINDDDPTSGAAVISNAMVSLGNVSKFSITPATTPTKIVDWRTPNDAIADAWSAINGGTLDMVAEEASASNFALNLLSRVVNVSPASATAAKIAYKGPVTKKWTEVDSAMVLKSGTAYYFVKSISDDGLSYTPYELIDTSTFVLYDSSATPKVLTVGTDYAINALTGKLTLKGSALQGVNLPGLTYPLMADFDQGLFVDILPVPLMQGRPYILSQKNVTSFFLKDSSTPQKIIPDTHYTLDAKFGKLTLTDKASILAISGLALPLQAYGTQGSYKAVGMMPKTQNIKKIRLDGENSLDGRAICITLYRVSFTPSAMDFLDPAYNKQPLKAELLSDPTKPYDDLIGQYGRIEYLD